MREVPPPEVMGLLMRRFAGRPEKYGSPDLTNEELRALAPWLEPDESSPIRHYDRRGKRISMWEWAARMENGRERVVAQTHLPSGVVVSTVFLAVDHGFGGGPPVLWETMLFFDGKKGWGDSVGPQWRYTSEDEAHAEHARIAKKWMFRKRPRRIVYRYDR